MLRNVDTTNKAIDSEDMHVSATVQRLTVFLVFKFVNRIIVSEVIHGLQPFNHYICANVGLCECVDG